MPSRNQVGIRARIACLSLASASIPLAGGGPTDPIEVVFPPELQASLFHSLPIAGLLVTPDAIAERVLLNPRLRATTSQPSSGKGTAYPIPESNVVSTRADPPD
jgi:hypothetical protein